MPTVTNNPTQPPSSSRSTPATQNNAIGNSVADITAKLKQEIDTLTIQSKGTPPQRTPSEEASYNKILQVVAKKILNTTGADVLPDVNKIYADEYGNTHTPPLPITTGAKQEAFLESAARNIYQQKIQPAINREKKEKEAQKLKAEQEFNASYPGRIYNWFKSLYTPSATPTSNSPGSPTASPVGESTNASQPTTTAATSTGGGGTAQNGSTTPANSTDASGAATSTGTAGTVPNGSTTSANSTDASGAATSTGGVEQAEEAAPVTSADQAAKKDETTKPENEKKEEKGGGFLKGYVGTKLSIGAALLAGGIALKMTLIALIPGLIMAGAGAAIMAWGAANYLFGDKDDKKQEKKE
ncbi:hypothetical protein [Vampirovibrio sp.]|uniref:hypothetical protein n=1 Tax=Vampirovibrio sp. TaxID=2717857 RepID=UPI0035943E60